ncbi:MFS transporter [Kitasatospora aburaviensis]
MRYVRLLRRGPVLLLWGAQTASAFGDRLYAMAVMWMAWEHAGAGAMGLVAVAESLPYIVLGTVGRRVMDRFASLRALAVVDAVRLVLVAALPWAWAEFGTVGLITSAALLGVGGALFDPNLGAMVPDLVRPGEVQAVSGLIDLTGRIARIAGPGAAGLLLAVMPLAGVFWVDAATFALSALALVLLAARVRPAAAAPQARPHAAGCGRALGRWCGPIRTPGLCWPCTESGSSPGRCRWRCPHCWLAASAPEPLPTRRCWPVPAPGPWRETWWPGTCGCRSR